MLPQETIRAKRDGQALSREQIAAFVQGLVDAPARGGWSDAQVAALAMAVCCRGMATDETVALTQAMTASGQRLDWRSADLPGPVIDKHSTGGVGDKVSLMLAPIVAACGGFVPMISGRGLGHTGGTLDKFDSIPGYQTAPSLPRFREVVRQVGCAIVGQTGELAPADRRLYAIRDVTATVESVPLITASILSKKLAAGLQGLVMDVKVGNGAFLPTLAAARQLAQSVVEAAQGAGLPTHALLTDMNEVLGDSAGNALEVLEAVAFLRGERREPRLLEVTRRLSAQLLCAGALAHDEADALRRVDHALNSGAALERFAAMVSALGGPADFTDRPRDHLARAPAQREVPSPADGWVAAMRTRDIGVLLIELGGGRRQAADAIDHRVGLSAVKAVGAKVRRGEPLAVVHAADDGAAEVAVRRLQALVRIDTHAPTLAPVIVEHIARPNGAVA